MKEQNLDTMDLCISGVTLRWEEDGVELCADGSTSFADGPFAGQNFKPNKWRAYMQFHIQHAMPVVAGPTMKGNHLAYHPAVIERSVHGLIHQQMNLEHRIKRYHPDNKAIRDRIVGAVVGVHFPKRPITGWQIPADPEAAPYITAVAAIFKQAEGVPRVIGEHQSSSKVWNNSIEILYPLDEMGLFIPSTREVIPTLAELPPAMKNAITRDPKTNHLLAGKYRGEQMALAPGGINGTIDYQGVGMTKFPAEKTAGIDQILASGKEVGTEMESAETEEGNMLVAVQAEAHSMMMFVKGVSFLDAQGRRVWARVKEITQEGIVKLDGCEMQATPENPVLLVRTVIEGRVYELLRKLSGVAVV
jgi:hypothetical protein